MTTTTSLDLADDGRIVLTLEDGPITLKVPKVKEYRALKAKLQETNVGLRAWAEREQDEADADATPETFEPIDYFGPLVVEIIETLGDRTPPEVDEMPVWLVESSEATSAMFVHWRTVPLGRGGQVPPR